MIASVGSALLNIGLNALFIPKYGFVAAGYTTLVSYVLCSVAHYLFMRRVTKKYMDGYKVYDIKKIMIIGLSLAVASAGMLALYKYMIIRYAILLVFAVVVFCFRKRIIALFKEMKKES